MILLVAKNYCLILVCNTINSAASQHMQIGHNKGVGV